MTSTQSAELLLAEDSRTQALHLRRLLEKNGYTVHVCSDGQKAANAAKQLMPALVLSDVIMPGMDGYELCTTLKAAPETRRIPVVLLTALSDPRDIVRGLECRADAFLIKPVDEQVLVTRLRYVLASTEMRQTRHAEIGIEIHVSGRRHFVDADRIQIIELLLSSFETAICRNLDLEQHNAELRWALHRIQALEANYRGVLESSEDAMVVTDAQGTCLYANSATNRVLGTGFTDLAAHPFPLFSHGSPGKREVRIQKGPNDEVVVSVTMLETDWRNKPALLFAVRDVTELVKTRDELHDLSTRDELTGLLNRLEFLAQADQQIQEASRCRTRASLLFVDVDRFRSINDTYGHGAGDEALVAVASCLRHACGDSDIIARVGGDEFAVFAPGMEAASVTGLIRRLHEQVDVHNTTHQDSFTLSVGTGTALFDPDEPKSINALLSMADEQMYSMKREKRANSRPRPQPHGIDGPKTNRSQCGCSIPWGAAAE